MLLLLLLLLCYCCCCLRRRLRLACRFFWLLFWSRLVIVFGVTELRQNGWTNRLSPNPENAWNPQTLHESGDVLYVKNLYGDVFYVKNLYKLAD